MPGPTGENTTSSTKFEAAADRSSIPSSSQRGPCQPVRMPNSSWPVKPSDRVMPTPCVPRCR
jgi:hypothetical protein